MKNEQAEQKSIKQIIIYSSINLVLLHVQGQKNFIAAEGNETVNLFRENNQKEGKYSCSYVQNRKTYRRKHCLLQANR